MSGTNVHQKKRAAWSYLVNAFNFRNIGDSVGSVFVIVGFNLSLEIRRQNKGLD